MLPSGYADARGIKRLCDSCDFSFYDLASSPIICPNCKVTFTPQPVISQQFGGPRLAYRGRREPWWQHPIKKNPDATSETSGPGKKIKEPSVGPVKDKPAAMGVGKHVNITTGFIGEASDGAISTQIGTRA